MGKRLISLLAIIPFSAGCSGGLDLLHFDQSHPRVLEDRPLTESPGDDYLPAFSPDGRFIAFTSYRSGTEEIWIMDSDGRNLKPLTTDPRKDWSPSWSPDGRKITFTSDRTGTNQIWVMESDGSRQSQLTRPTRPDVWSRDSSFSPDGTRIVYTTNESGKEENWIMMADGSDPYQHSRSERKNCHPYFTTPDGRGIIFTSGRTGVWGLWISDLNGEISGDKARELISGPQFDINLTASVSPDGRWMIYRTADGNLYLADPTAHIANQLIKNGSVEGWRVSWSPDGRRIAYTKRVPAGRSSYQTDIWAITLRS